MTSITDYSKQGLLAFSSYANLSRGSIVDIAPLTAAGLSEGQARAFASEWVVLDQHNAPSGLSATVFQKASGGQRYLAIRGTEITSISAAALDLTADYVLALGLPPQLNPQFISLRSQVQRWLADGTLTQGFTATGHSLGGYLAGAIGIAFGANVSSVYSYNAPGLGGSVFNTGYQVLRQAFSIGNASASPTTYNLRGSRGLSLISGLGVQLSPPIRIEIEGAPGLGLDNHSIARITDSLAVHALLAQFNSAYDIDKIALIVNASSSRDLDTLEEAINPLLRAFGMPMVSIEDRSALFARIDDLSSALTNSQRPMEIRALVGQSSPDVFSWASEGDGIAYRNALVNLDPYAVIGGAAFYIDQNNATHALDLYDPETGTGLTDEYLSDRAAMLAWKIKDYSADGDVALRGNRAETIKYVDKSLRNAAGTDLTFTVAGRRQTSVGNPALIVFGSEGVDTLTGSNLAMGDRLYGAGGNDTLNGLEGDDYLEGGLGADLLTGGAGADDLNGGHGFDIYVYDDGDGFDTITDTGRDGTIQYNGRFLAGGSNLGEGVYQDSAGISFLLGDDGSGGLSLLIGGHIYLEDFEDGELNIFLEGDTPAIEQPESESENSYFNSSLPVGFDAHSDQYGFMREYYGSSEDDLFLASVGLLIIGRTGNDAVFFEGAGRYDSLVDMGADDDLIDYSASSGADQFGRLAGGGGNDYILGSQSDDRIWGDNYFAISAEAFFQSSRREGVFLVDDLIYMTDERDVYRDAMLLPSGGVLKTVGGTIVSQGGIYPEDDSVTKSDGVLFDGTLEETIAAVIGSSGNFDDYIDAGDGDDTVTGGSGSDEIHGGSGDDSLFGDYRDIGRSRFSGEPSYQTLEAHFGELASLFGRFGNDDIYGGDGNDWISDMDGGDDLLSGGEGDDLIESREDLWRSEDGEGAHNVIHGGAGNDTLEVVDETGGFDVVDGGEGNDRIDVFAETFSLDDSASGGVIIFGGNGNDVLLVGADNGFVDGGAGDDDYTVFGKSIVVTDSSGDDILHTFLPDLGQVDAWLDTFPVHLTLAPGWDDIFDRLTSVVLREGSDLVLTSLYMFPNEEPVTTELRIEDWFKGATYQIENVEIGVDGPVMTSGQFESWGGVHYGSDDGDILADSSDYSDRAFGGAGDDLIATGDGADRISGGSGNDELIGGSGDDIYYYALGDGDDLISDISGADEIRFGGGIALTTVAVSFEESGIVLTVGSGRIELSDASRSDVVIEQLRFLDGSVVSLASLLPVLPQPAPEPDGASAQDPIVVVGAGPEVDSSGSPSGPVESSSPVIPQPVELPAFLPVVIQPASGLSSSETIPVLEVTNESFLPPSRPPYSDVNFAFGEVEAPLQFGGATEGSRESETEGDLADADRPLDLQTMLDAVEAFNAGDAGSRSVGAIDGGRQPDPLRSPPAEGQLTNWALTNALIQFHLDRSDAGGAGEAPGDLAHLPGFGAGIDGVSRQQGLALSVFGSRSRGLSTFSGLQEGFTRL